MPNKNAPGHRAEGVACLPGSNIDAYNTDTARVQFLAGRFGLSFNRASAMAPLIFGEAAHA